MPPMRRRLPDALLPAALAVAVALVACETTPASPAPSLDPAFTSFLATITGDGDPTASPIDAFWESALPDYDPPTSVTGYRAGEIPDATICGDHDDPDSWRNNAFYCPADGTIVYDVDLLADLYRSSGALAPLGIIAHEWGHHVQEARDEGDYSIQDELMADCLAGMFASSIDEGAANADQMVAFYGLGNQRYQSSTWFQALEHGSPNQRAAAWSLGYLTIEAAGVGYPTCRGYASWEPGRVAQLGPYRIVELPGRLGAVDGDTYTVEATAGAPGVSVTLLELTDPLDAATIADQLVAGLQGEVRSAPVEVTVADAAAAYYSVVGADHGFLGVIAPPGSESALAVVVRGAGTLSSWETPTPADEAAAFAATNLGLIVMGRVCAPGQSAEGGTPSDRFNAYCAPDL